MGNAVRARHGAGTKQTWSLFKVSYGYFYSKKYNNQLDEAPEGARVEPRVDTQFPARLPSHGTANRVAPLTMHWSPLPTGGAADQLTCTGVVVPPPTAVRHYQVI